MLSYLASWIVGREEEEVSKDEEDEEDEIPLSLPSLVGRDEILDAAIQQAQLPAHVVNVRGMHSREIETLKQRKVNRKCLALYGRLTWIREKASNLAGVPRPSHDPYSFRPTRRLFDSSHGPSDGTTAAKVQVERFTLGDVMMRVRHTIVKANGDDNIESVNLGGNKCLSKHVAPCALRVLELRHLHSIRHLLLHNCALDSNNLEQGICEMLSTSPMLRSLNLASNQIADISALAEALKASSSLRSLSLRKNSIVSLSPLADALKTNNVLSVLDLSSNTPSEESVECFAEVLRTQPSLRDLSLADCALKPKALSSLLHHMQENGSIRTLTLSGNEMPRDNSLAELITHNKAIQVLNWNAFRREGYATVKLLEIGEALSANTSLGTLSLHNVTYDYTNREEFFRKFAETNISLFYLDISSSFIDGSVLISPPRVGAVLKQMHNTSLCTVYCRAHPRQPEDEELKHVLKRNRKLNEKWSVSKHAFMPLEFRQQVMTVMLLARSPECVEICGMWQVMPYELLLFLIENMWDAMKLKQK